MHYKGYFPANYRHVIHRCLDRLTFSNVPDHFTVKIQLFESPHSPKKTPEINSIGFALWDNDEPIFQSAVYGLQSVNINEIRLYIKKKLSELCPDLNLK